MFARAKRFNYPDCSGPAPAPKCTRCSRKRSSSEPRKPRSTMVSWGGVDEGLDKISDRTPTDVKESSIHGETSRDVESSLPSLSSWSLEESDVSEFSFRDDEQNYVSMFSFQHNNQINEQSYEAIAEAIYQRIRRKKESEFRRNLRSLWVSAKKVFRSSD